MTGSDSDTESDERRSESGASDEATADETEDAWNYVLEDGKFVGNFEEMYQNIEDPWGIDEVDPLKEDVALILLKRRAEQFGRILSLGCAKGRFLNRIHTAVGGEQTVGFDVSFTAVSKGSERYPGIDFGASAAPDIPCDLDTFDLVVVSELLWLVIEDLPKLFEEVRRVLAEDGIVLLVQQFYGDDDQSYGNEVMERPEDLIEMLPFNIVQRAHVDGDPTGNHSFLAILEI